MELFSRAGTARPQHGAAGHSSSRSASALRRDVYDGREGREGREGGVYEGSMPPPPPINTPRSNPHTPRGARGQTPRGSSPSRRFSGVLTERAAAVVSAEGIGGTWTSKKSPRGGGAGREEREASVDSSPRSPALSPRGGSWAGAGAEGDGGFAVCFLCASGVCVFVCTFVCRGPCTCCVWTWCVCACAHVAFVCKWCACVAYVA